MRVIYNNVFPFKGFKAINICGVVFVRGNSFSEVNRVHEEIHTLQMRELLFIPFYIIYVVEWIVRLFLHGFNNNAAYHSISFEQEAYNHQREPSYIQERRHFAEWK